MPSDGHLNRAAIHRVIDASDPQREGFVDAYKEIFAGPPYFEAYTDGDVISGVWNPHIGQCILVAVDTSGRVIGFGCCHSVMSPAEPKIRDFILSRPGIGSLFDPERTIFMSEIAVREECRRRGLGKRLIFERFRWGLEHGFSSYCMRTAEHGSNSRRLYERMGAKRAPFVQDVSADIDSASKSRIYLYGSLVDALAEQEN